MTKLVSARVGIDKLHKFAMQLGLIWFPIAVLANTFSMTALLIFLGLVGYAELAADIGLVQGATLATFYAFSANARNLILTDGGELVARRLLHMRLLLVLPLAFIAYFLSVGVGVGSVNPTLAMILIMRRGAEWFGELGLSQLERCNQNNCVRRTVFGEAVGFILCLFLLICVGADLASSLIPWAFVPLLSVFSSKFSLPARSKLFTIQSLLPHIGSTAIIGTCIYMFRISLTVLAGKAGAGELFTAFAIGGIIPTIFGQALAPTILRHFGSTVIKSGWLKAFCAAMLASMSGLVILTIFKYAWIIDSSRSAMFWLATGLSIAGGAVMIVAALLRAHLFHSDEQEVFGVDVLANILLVSLVPLIYFTLGAKSLAGLYLLSACLNLFYAWGAFKRKSIDGRFLCRIMFALGLLLVAPIFVQLEGNFFRDPALFFDAGGRLIKLPIPVSVFAMFGGIAVLGNYKVAKHSLAVLFFTMLMLVMSVFRGGGSVIDGGKLLFMSQFVFPMFGLVLGQMFGAFSRGHVFERAALLMLLLILPAQLMASWLAGHTDARPLVFIFSIYQHLHYFPAIAAVLATMSSLALWSQSRSNRIAIGFMFLIVPVHLVASMSVNAIASATCGMAAFMTFHWRYARFRRHLSATLTASLLAATFYVLLVHTAHSVSNRQSIVEASVASWSVSAADVNRGAEKWHFFADEISASPEVFLFGHATRPDRNQLSNAHNYWLDAIYSFGIIAILPLISSVAMTALMVWKHRSYLLTDPLLLGTAMAAGYLVLIESMLNVGMRQPYPGILTFFILGLLISRLRSVG